MKKRDLIFAVVVVVSFGGAVVVDESAMVVVDSTAVVVDSTAVVVDSSMVVVDVLVLDSAAVSVTVAVPLIAEFSTLVARTVAVGGEGSSSGAV